MIALNIPSCHNVPMNPFLPILLVDPVNTLYSNPISCLPKNIPIPTLIIEDRDLVNKLGRFIENIENEDLKSIILVNKEEAVSDRFCRY